MDRRRRRRIVSVLPVRVWGIDAHAFPFAQAASVRNFSGAGAVVQGVRRHVQPGETLELQCGRSRAQFRIVWVGKPGTPREGEIGVESLPEEACLWGDTLCRSAESGGEG